MSDEGALRPERKRLAVQLASGFAELSYVVYEPPKFGRTVLCIPDFLGNSADFSRLATMLAAHGFRVICPDLPGRGESAYLGAADYNPHTYMVSLLTLAQSLGNGRLMAIGKGWGALLALGLARLPELTVSRLVVADLGLPWKLAIDEAIAKAVEGPGFASLEEARRLLAGSAEFAGLPPGRALPLIDGRLRQTEIGYGLDFDPALLSAEATARFARVRITPLFEGLRARLLYLSASSLTQRDRMRLRPIIAAAPYRTLADNLSRAARLHFTSSHELLLILGFLLNRSLPAA
jgi:pimeloyl-ACP methyl ester carboxylesterase